MDNNVHKHPTPELTDEELVQQIRNGSKTELDSIVRYLHQRFQGLVAQIVGRFGGDLEDDTAYVLNDSLLVLIKKIHDGSYEEGRSSLSTYFYSIAEKQLLNRLRKKQRQARSRKLPAPLLILNDVEEKTNSKEVKEKIAAAFKQLDEPCQQVLRKFWIEDKSMKEISEEMDISVDAAKQRNHRCMKKLRDLLENDFKDWFKDK